MNLGQYYTNEIYSDLLVTDLESKNAAQVLDIGCGKSNLLNAASRRWKKAKLIGFDIDPKNLSFNNNKLSLQYGDGLDPDLSDKILDTFGTIDVSVSNPPYLNVDYNKDVKQILNKVGMCDALSKNFTQIPAELVFIAQNLLVLKNTGELGVILPASIINGERWGGVREYLISEYSVNSCTQLPVNAFKQTETATFTVCLEKHNAYNSCTKLSHHSNSETINIGREDAIHRMDFSYYKCKATHRGGSSKLNIESITRGNKTEKYLRSSNSEYLHTSNLKENFQIIEVSNDFSKPGYTIAEAGDIVIARVGSRCVGKSALVKSGKISVSDCLFVVRVSDYKQLLKHLESGNFKRRVENSALGIGAKYITRKLLEEMIHGT